MTPMAIIRKASTLLGRLGVVEGAVQQGLQQGGEVLVVPTGEDDAGDEAADREEFPHDAAPERGDSRPGEDDDEEQVEWVERKDTGVHRDWCGYSMFCIRQ